MRRHWKCGLCKTWNAWARLICWVCNSSKDGSIDEE